MKKIYIFFIVLPFILTGCTSTLLNVKPNKNSTDKESIIFGRIGMDVPNMARIVLNLVNVDTGVRYQIQKLNGRAIMGPNKNEDGSGYFIVSLSPGRYQCFRIDQQDNAMISSIYTKYFFDVPPDSNVYLGTIYFQELESKNYILFGTSKVQVGISDELEGALAYFSQRGYQFNKNNVTKNIFSEISNKNNK